MAGLLPLPPAVTPLLNQVMKVISTAPPQLSFSMSIPSHGKETRPTNDATITNVQRGKRHFWSTLSYVAVTTHVRP
jgi:hypothetical protein